MPRKFLERFKRLDEIIRSKSSGTPAQLAAKLDISESTLFEFIAVMKEHGAPIHYDKNAMRYIYTEPGHFNTSFIPE